MSIEAMKQALDALDCINSPLHMTELRSVGRAITALRAAIESQERVMKLRQDIAHHLALADGINAELAMQRLTDVQQAIEIAVADQATYGMGITLGGKRIDPASIYKRPEPVAWMYDWTTSEGEFIQNWTTSEAETLRDTEPTIISNVRPLYTHPPRREWVGLTDEEIRELSHEHRFSDDEHILAIMAALKEKNS
jgi:hypothetical protein